MDRYSFLHGTRVDGTLTFFGGSVGRDKFFSSLGATDPKALRDRIHQILNGMQVLPHYENEPADVKPVAVRYAPMHLYRKRETASIKAFCAMNIAGNEHRMDRESVYDHTLVWSVKEMCEGKQYNHVDLLFGTKLTGWQEVMRFRNREANFDYDRPPDKVIPRIKNTDTALCIRCVEAIYAGQNVVIRIERGHNFNSRSREILMQIYSLLQPKLAVEVGFAAYQAPEDIAKLANELSMRIFVIPAGCSLEKVPKSFELLDLAENDAAIKLEHSPLVDTLVKWLNYDWEKRLAAYRALFADVIEYQNADIFVQRSEEFFAADAKLTAWKTSVKKGSVATMDELREVYSRHIESSIVPWAKHEFEIRIPGMIAAGKTIDSMLTDEAVSINTTSGAEQKKASERYLFAKNYGTIEVARLSRELLAYQTRVSDEKWNAVMAEENKKASAALAQEQERTRTAQAETLEAKAEGDRRVAEECQRSAAQLKAAKEAAAVALTQEQERTRAAQAETLEAKAEGDRRVAEVREQSAAQLTAAKEAAAVALAQEQARGADERNALIAQHTQAMNEEKLRYDEMHKKATAAYTTMKTRAESAESNLTTIKTEMESARQDQERKLAELKSAAEAALAKERKKIRDADAQARTEITAREAEINRLKGMLKIEPKDLDELRGQLRRAQDAGNNLKDENAKLKQKGLIGIVAGVLVGALLCGGVIGLISLLGKDEKPVETQPVETEMVTEPVETEIPETTEPVETTVPQVTEPETLGWTDEAFVQEVMATVPDLKTVVTEDAAEWLPENSTLSEGYSVVAMLSATDLAEWPEEGTAPYLLLLEADAEQDTELETQETEAPQDTEPEQQDTEEPQKQTSVFDITAENGATLALAWGDQLLVVYGGDAEQCMALQLAAFCALENEPVMLYEKSEGELLDISAVMAQILEENWAEDLRHVGTDDADMMVSMEELHFLDMPAVQISCESVEVYLFGYPQNAEDVDLVKEYGETAGWTVIETENSMVIVVPKAED